MAIYNNSVSFFIFDVSQFVFFPKCGKTSLGLYKTLEVFPIYYKVWLVDSA